MSHDQEKPGQYQRGQRCVYQQQHEILDGLAMHPSGVPDAKREMPVRKKRKKARRHFARQVGDYGAAHPRREERLERPEVETISNDLDEQISQQVTGRSSSGQEHDAAQASDCTVRPPIQSRAAEAPRNPAPSAGN
jgi:hypothetical protein